MRAVNSSGVVAAISEDLVKTLRISTVGRKQEKEEEEEKSVKFKVRAVATVRNKNKEDFKETLVKHLDAFTDKIGRNVVLELMSTQVDPSKSLLIFTVGIFKSSNLTWVWVKVFLFF